MRHEMQLSAVALLLVLVPACDENSTGPGGPAVDCGADVTEVDVSITTTADDVTFDWSPRCRVSYLGVEAGAGDRWWIGVEDENLIEPPVRYGETPDGVPAETALSLEDGETYELILWLSTSSGDQLLAVEEFER